MTASISSECQIPGITKAPPPPPALLWGFLADCGTGLEQGYCGICCEEVKAQGRKKSRDMRMKKNERVHRML